MTQVNYEILLDDNYVVSAATHDSAIEKYDTAVAAFAQSAGVVTLKETTTTILKSSHSGDNTSKYGLWEMVVAVSQLLKDWAEDDLADMFNIDKDAAASLLDMAKQFRGK